MFIHGDIRNLRAAEWQSRDWVDGGEGRVRCIARSGFDECKARMQKAECR